MGKTNFQVLIDSDAFLAHLMPDDLLHEAATQVFAQLEQTQAQTVTTSAVVAETATVLSHRVDQATVRLFLEQIDKSRLPVIHIDEELQRQALELFRKQTTKGISMVDCDNVIVMRRLEIPQVFSFDKFYTTQGCQKLP